MYRLLVVDDEPAIVDGLVQIFHDTEEFELDVCKAYSAYEAIELVKKTKIDVVLSDIRMPGKSGLQMIEDILFYWPSCRIIFLTGYSEFDYVYTAIQKNVENYILKTEGMEKILAVVKQAINKLDEETRNKSIVEKAEKQILLMGPLLKKELFEALLSGEASSDIFSNGRFADLALSLDVDLPLLMLAGRVDSWGEEVTYTGKLNLFYSIKDISEGYLPSLFRMEDVVYDHSMLVWFIQPDLSSGRFEHDNGETDWRGIVIYLKGILESIQNACRDLLGVSVSFAISKEAMDWDGIYKEFEMLKGLIKKRMVLGQKMAIIDPGVPDSLLKMEIGKQVSHSQEFNKKLKQLDKCIEEGDEHLVGAVLKDIIHGLKQDIAGNYLLGLERYYTFALALLSHVNSLNMSDKLNDDLQIANFPILELPAEWEKAEKYMIELSEYICVKKRAQHEKGENLLVERIHRFVVENLGGDLSLARIAEVVYFNPSYLSRFYKQLTGRNLTEYINSVKTETAAGMLEEMQLKVNEIALKLGFESPSYFTAVFKKMTGITPQEYREAYISKMR